MTDNETLPTEIEKLPEPVIETVGDQADKKGLVIAIVIAVVLLIGIIVGLVLLAGAGETTVAKVRDIFIIMMALMMFVIGVALVVLIIQLANLTNLLQTEVKPILTSTTDTINTLKGTVRFMSDNLTEPVIKLNQSLASIRKLGDLFRLKNQ